MDLAEFTKWTKFEDVKALAESTSSGVYVLSRYKKSPNGPLNFTSKNIVYIGETTKQSIRTRLNQFGTSAFKRKNGHSGGWTYSEQFLGSTISEVVPSDIYVSFLPIDINRYDGAAYIKFVERLLILRYVQKNKKNPACNKS
ncbi:hypothetical protein PE36_07427 [Moritella sp. PE36]|uniref:hypothetical protein n=1 Tax=Moritella sp. PE36 TaxID=58051 RepID=UPI00015689D5|nr:hypothetical protein [Moritella sp. PE36]EDM69300.1 hypothetical protein PE36_07427 [Moritella sp. PE36]